MDPRHLDLAAEFCALTGSPDLLSYLGLEPPYTAEDAAAKLKERRRYMQGMQANPKYRQEALGLIRNLSAFQALLQNPDAYLSAVRDRAQSAHLPVLEVTIRGVLKGGRLLPEQEAFLRRNAAELGVSEAAFESTLARVAGELGVPLDAAPPPEKPAPAPPVRDVKTLPPRGRPPRARLDDPPSLTPMTGPPARSRDLQPGAPQHALTAPPNPRRSPRGASMRPVSLSGPARDHDHMKVLGDTVRKVSLRGSRVTATVQITLDGKVAARVSSDQPWLMAEPTRLPIGTTTETLKVRIDPQGLVGQKGTGVLTVQTDDGERVAVAFEVERRSAITPAVIVGALLLVACIAGAAIAGSMAARYAPLAPSSLTITVEPTSEEILINERHVGQGDLVRVDAPPTGIVTVEVRQERFRPWRNQIEIPPGQDTTMHVVLELAEPLDFKPTQDMQRTSLNQEIARRVMAPRTAQLDECVRQGVDPVTGASGSIRVHVGTDGRVVGLDFDESARQPGVIRCVERVVALLQFPALVDGAYATLRYDYAVPPQGPGR